MKVMLSSENESFGVVLSGDVCPGGLNGVSVARDLPGVMADVAPFIRGADLRLVQWETPLASVPAPIIKHGPNLNSSDDSVEIVASAGFDIAMLANNHIGDQGPDAVLETIEKLTKRGLATVGAGRDLDSARLPLVREVRGRSVAIFNFAENEFGGARTHHPGSAAQDPLRDLAEVRAAAENYDFVIVTLHGGHERYPFPSPRMVRYCRSLADAGAKLVFNCHTHCPQGYEIRHGTPIVYSPGNFYFPEKTLHDGLWNYGYLVRCGFGDTGAVSLELLPVRFDNDKVSRLSEAENAKFDSYLAKLCAPIRDPERLRHLFESWCTMSGKHYYEVANAALPPGTGWLGQINEPVILKRAMRVRNVFTCESHNDMIKCWFRLVEEQRVAEAAAGFDEIAELQKGFLE